MVIEEIQYTNLKAVPKISGNKLNGFSILHTDMLPSFCSTQLKYPTSEIAIAQNTKNLELWKAEHKSDFTFSALTNQSPFS